MMNRNGNEGECSDDRMIAVMLSEEYAKLDGAVTRRLSNLAPLPHIPRINSYIPNLSDATLDHHRLLQRLNLYGLHEVKVSGDGNCQFRALSDQMYRSPDHHKHVRKEIVKQACILKDFRSLYDGYVPMKYKRYYKKMAKLGEWGDHVTLQAAADKSFKHFFLGGGLRGESTSLKTFASLQMLQSSRSQGRNTGCSS
ncbi:OTU domain containing protein [Trema orientale]|uniref:OTU domain containing protein n=1 Tax=Trema orientale TaxID=63057 RepID=A0A2P5EDD3_TREOI|nr:OTU domain containing protein [Trema orientale]